MRKPVRNPTTSRSSTITADTDLRLCRYFGLSDGWWLRGQVNYDTAIAREAMGDVLARISRCELLAR
jgi:antitoxin HigA-1